MHSIYLDHAATTPLSTGALEAMLPYLTEHYGNPSSLHRHGQKAKQALTDARDAIASELNCAPGQLFFTSGGTESDNAAIFGVIEAARKHGKSHMITTEIEHHAVLHACERLERSGIEVTYIPVDMHGRVSPEDIAKAIRPDTALISVMYANNEVGTVQPIQEIGELARASSVTFHVDAVQALGAIPIDLARLPVDLMSFSAHKIYGPKGIGLLYSGKQVHWEPLLYGGAQERRKRPGTENVAAAAGFAYAVRQAVKDAASRQQRMGELRRLFLTTLDQEIGSSRYKVNGHEDSRSRLESIVNISFAGIDKETMLMNLDLAGISASGGSACTSGSLEDSHVLTAMKLPGERIKSAVRFSFGSDQTAQQVVEAAQKIGTIIRRIRKT